MQIRLYDLKLPIAAPSEELRAEIARALCISESCVKSFRIYRKSLDARRASNMQFIYAVDADISDSARYTLPNKAECIDGEYVYTVPQLKTPALRPVVVGFGPCGIFASLLLARAGCRPIVLERGDCIEDRTRAVNTFFESGILDENSNVQFGEGGAGAFSDGKLNTLIKDKNKRGRFILAELVKAGVPEEILYINKPHVGTDHLKTAISNIRREIISLGGEIKFNHNFTRYEQSGGRLRGIYALDRKSGREHFFESDTAFLCIGHSARDTVEYLSKTELCLERKIFSVGVRIEHTQEWLNKAQYKENWNSPYLKPADYKLVAHTQTGRALYTFCMCPGGVVVPAASEKGGVVTNGMSYFARDKVNANSALLCNVNPEDFAGDDVLAGMRFQRMLEERAFELGGGEYRAPAQTVGDFLNNKTGGDFGAIRPSYARGVCKSDLRKLLPSFVCDTLKEGLLQYDRSICGFACPDAVLIGVESRSSSPVRIVRNEQMQSVIDGLFPLGEGAGYAGGIMSAAIDGMKAAEIYFEYRK